MTGTIKRFIALALALALLISPFSEIRLYAAQMQEHSEAESETDQNEENTEKESLTQCESSGESESSMECSSESESSEDGIGESETDMQNTAESESESAYENETETVSETVTEPETENAAETAEEIETEAAQYPCPTGLEPENVPYDENQDAFTDALANKRSRNADLPRYDAREKNYLPAIRNQGTWGACWSFSLLGAMEVSAVRDMGAAADEIDLSERHLAYFGYNTGYDALGNANKDTMTSPPEYYLTNGGNDIRGVIRLMNWNGGADEATYPYVSGNLPEALERAAAQDADVYLENAYRYNFASAILDENKNVDLEKKAQAIKVVKRMISDYGAVSWSYYSDSKYLNAATGAYYNNSGGSGTAKTNHAIMAVGWDDNYAKENFKEGIRPQNDGAWIIRNSWGTGNGDGGYNYISYEDVSLGSGNPVYAFTVCDSAKYDNNYFYGNTAYSNATIAVKRAAQVFQIKSENAVREKMTAVSFLIGTSNVKYELQVYKNPDIEEGKVTDPTSGTPMFSTPQTGVTGYAGMHTIEFAAPVLFDADDYAAVVLTFPDTSPNMYFDRSYTSDSGKQRGVHIIEEGRSFYSSNLTSWKDNYGNDRTFRINALTVNSDEIVSVPEIKKIDVKEAQDFGSFPQINIWWSKCTGAQGYKIYRSEDGKNYELIYTSDSSVRAYTDTLPKRKAAQYFYKAEAVYSDRTELSEAVAQNVKGVIEAPKLTLSSYNGYQAVFAWEDIKGADGYELWRVLDNGNEDAEDVHVEDFTSGDAYSYVIDTDGWALGNYYYKLRAVHGNEYTNWSTACINRNLTWRQNSYYRAYFEWIPVSGASSYKLFHKVNGKTFSATVKNASALMNMESANYRPCDEHQYYVKAYDESGKEIIPETGVSSTIVFQMKPDAVSIQRIEYDYENTVAITWDGSLGADRTAIYRSETASDKGELIAEIDAQTDTFYYEDTVSKGKTYWYYLVPSAMRTDGGWTKGQPALSDKVLTFPETVTLEAAQYMEGNGVNLVWKTAKGAEGYIIERSDNQGDFRVLNVLEGNSAAAYTDKTVEAGNRYRYRIQSYFTAEDGSRIGVPAIRVLDTAVLPRPAAFSTIAEQKQGGQTVVRLLWDAEQNVQSYTIYRSETSKQDTPKYVCIAKNITEGQYIDNTVVPDTSYSYKLAVTVNGLNSDLEKTEAKTITTRPVLTALEMSIEDIEIARDTWKAFKIMPKPAHYPYEQELIWSAYDENDNVLEIVQKNDTLVINGMDGKEILYISDDRIYAVCASDTAKITLTAAIDGISAACKIFAYRNDFWVTGVKNLTYTGAALKQDAQVYDGNRLLTEGIDYTVTYKNNIKVSVEETQKSKKPVMTVKGKGSYTGIQTLNFEILPEPDADVSKKTILKTKVKNIGMFEYMGEALEPKPVVKDGSRTLIEGTDYKLSYKNNDIPGKAAIVIHGMNGYKGTKEVPFTVCYNIQKDEAELMRFVFETQEVAYAKGGAKPALHVYCGNQLLEENTDYKLSYKNNTSVAAASDKKAPAVVITGKGSYKGKREAVFTIVKQDIGGLMLLAKDKVYTKKAGKFETSFVIVDKNGNRLSSGKDYDKASVKYTYADTGKPVGKDDMVLQGTQLCVTVNAAESGAYYGSVSGLYRIAAYDIGKAKVTVEAQTYTGSELEPDSDTGVCVSYKGYDSELAQGVDYEITGYDNNIKKGTAKLYIKGIGDFGGTKTVKFKIKTKPFQWWWQNK